MRGRLTHQSWRARRFTAASSPRAGDPLTITVEDPLVLCTGAYAETTGPGVIAKGRLEPDGRFNIFKSFGGGYPIQYAFDVAGRIVNRHLAKGTFYWINHSQVDPPIAQECVTPNPIRWRAGRDR